MRQLLTIFLLTISTCLFAGEIIVHEGESIHNALRQAREWRRLNDPVKEGQPVVIKYSTTPVSGQTYGSTCMTLNGLEFDVNPYSAMDPIPDNYDFHADGKNETGLKKITLQWTPASVAVSHRLVFGTDSTEVANSTTYQYQGKNTQYEAFA